ncbi:MAG: hypothetical protein AAF432_07500 [Planctomycetota bacterium]
MTMQMVSRLVVLAVTGAVATSAQADLVVDSGLGLALDVEFTVGSGEQTSYMVVDFAATGGDSYAFAYQYSQFAGARSYDMLLAVTDAMQGLSWDFGGEDGVGFGVFTNNFTYLGDTGDELNFWSFSLGVVDDPGIVWEGAGVGVSGRFLSEGSLDGWYNGFNPDFSTIPPTAPLTAIPAPGALLVMLGGGALAGTRRRRH